jgi:hypothetical protein
MRHTIQKLTYLIVTLLGIASVIALPASALTTGATTGTTTGTSSTTASTTAASKVAAAEAAAQQARLQRIISQGNLEIERRIVTLNTLSSKINSATKLTSSDAATLKNTVSGDLTTLNTLKTQLDSDTTVTAAITDAESIITNYRVYVLVVPQVDLVKAADDQQVAEGKLSSLATKLQSRIDEEQQKGVSVTTMESALTDLNSKDAAAQTISSNIETTVISLVPSDYNTNHSVLSGDRNQLVNAQTDIKTAEADAQTIITQLMSSSSSPSSSSPTPAQP